MSRSAVPARGSTATLVATVLVTLAGLVLTVLEWNSLALTDAAGDIGALAGTIAYAVLGVLIVRRAAGHLVGWFMLVEGTATAAMTTGSAYAIYGVKAHPGALPAAVAGLVVTGLSLASFMVSTRQVALLAPGGISLAYPNPLAVRSLRPVTWLGTLNGLALVFPLMLGGVVASLVLRYRRGGQRLRQQMKWLGLAIAGVLRFQRCRRPAGPWPRRSRDPGGAGPARRRPARRSP